VAGPETPHLLDLAAALSLCRALATNCNGPRHLAVAIGVPTLTVHMASDPRAWNPPDDPRHPVARAEELACIGCGRNACPYRLECSTLMTPERAVAFLAPLLDSPVAQARG